MNEQNAKQDGRHMVADRKLISYDIICKQCPVLVNVNRDEDGFQLALFAVRRKLEQEMRSCPTFHSYRSIVSPLSAYYRVD